MTAIKRLVLNIAAIYRVLLSSYIAASLCLKLHQKSIDKSFKRFQAHNLLWYHSKTFENSKNNFMIIWKELEALPSHFIHYSTICCYWISTHLVIFFFSSINILYLGFCLELLYHWAIKSIVHGLISTIKDIGVVEPRRCFLESGRRPVCIEPP